MSVSDKTNLLEFAHDLNLNGYIILATGNTARILLENRIDCIKIEDYTGFPEIFDGRVKTLQPAIFGGILMRRDNGSDIEQAASNEISPIDIVCVNLYPFPQVVNRTDIDLQTKIENIDIGGPSLIRAAAKNYKYVSVLTNPLQYKKFSEELSTGTISSETRTRLAYDAFSYTSYYDTLIANFFESEFSFEKKDIRINYPKTLDLRYGENPHQKGGFYGNMEEYFELLAGKELSYNNIVDLSAAVELVLDMEKNSCAIIKHTNAAGAANSPTVYESYINALSGDPVSAFGGIVAFNGIIDLRTAEKLNEIFLEIICAFDFEADAMELLLKKKNRRIIKIKKNKIDETYSVKSVPGGVIVQETDKSVLDFENIKVVTKQEFPEELKKDIKLAWTVCKHTKSNAIVYVKDGKVVGVGAGQMSRIDSAKIAALKAKEFGHSLDGAVAASDAFFPFPDGVEEIAAHGIQTIIQPGGSVRDEEVIAAAEKLNLVMIFTGIRNFKH